MGRVVNKSRQRVLGLAGEFNWWKSGHSLVEMVVVIAILSILLTIATLRYQDYARRYRTEAQTRLIFSELLKARVNAICQRRTTRVKLYPARFEVYSSQQDDSSGVKPLETCQLSYPIICSKTWDPALGLVIDFGADGLSDQMLSVCLDQSAGSGAVDSIKVHTTRVTIGKKDKGNECNSDNITIR